MCQRNAVLVTPGEEGRSYTEGAQTLVTPWVSIASKAQDKNVLPCSDWVSTGTSFVS